MSPNVSNEDEYQFNDMGSGVGNLYAPGTSAAPNPGMNRKRIFVTLFIMMLVYLSYKWIGGMLSSEKEVPKKPQTSVSDKVDSVQKDAPSSLLSKIQERRNQNATVQNGQDFSFAKSNLANQPPQADIQKDIGDIQTSVAAIQGQVGNLNYSMQLMAQQMQQQAYVVSQLTTFARTVIQKERDQQAKQTPPKKVVELPKTQYFLQAAIPGRAWLLDMITGSTTTVAEGDVLPGYGTVLHIDANQAMVTTSTGRNIQPKTDD